MQVGHTYGASGEERRQNGNPLRPKPNLKITFCRHDVTISEVLRDLPVSVNEAPKSADDWEFGIL